MRMAVRTIALSGWLPLCVACDTPPAAPQSELVAEAEPESLGPLYYRTYCVTCHGPEGKGDGPAAADLPTRPADLTRIVQRKGVFDRAKIAEFIDGRDRAKRHVAPDMPTWGRTLDDRLEVSLYQETRLTEPMIRELVRYLEALQVTPVEPDPASPVR